MARIITESELRKLIEEPGIIQHAENSCAEGIKYEGYLLFGLYNISSTPFPLIPNRKLVGAVFFELDESEINENISMPEPLEDFPDDLIRIIKEYEPVALKSIVDDINRLNEVIENDNNWKKTFQEALTKNQEALTKNNELITNISNSLKNEIEARKQGETTLKANDDELEQSVKNIEKNVITITIWAKIILGIVGVVVTGAIGYLIAILT